MSIRVEVRNESGEVIGPTPMQYHRIVGWNLRAEFPMLGYTNAVGNLTLNSLQVNDLLSELNVIVNLCESIGPTAALGRLGAPFEPDDFTISGWDPERDLLPMLEELVLLCKAIHLGEHRYLWFIGD